MSLLLAGLVAGVTGALALTRYALRPRKAAEPAKPAAPAAEAPLEGFACQVGDVVLRTQGEEAWLAGALVLTEGVPVAALFVAPDAGGDRVIFVTPSPSPTIAWLTTLDPASVLVGSEPPTAVEHEDVRFERVRRRPLRVVRRGAPSLDVGETAVLAEYVSAGLERMIVLLGASRTVAFRGEALTEGRYEVIPSGTSTLGDAVTPSASS